MVGTLEAKAGGAEVRVAEVISINSKWRPICVVVENQIGVFEFRLNQLGDSVLRFNPIQIAEWLAELLHRKDLRTQAALSRELGVDRSRIGQFLNLLRLPSGHLPRLKGIPDLTEYQLRPITVMTPKEQSAAIRQLLSGTECSQSRPPQSLA